MLVLAILFFLGAFYAGFLLFSSHKRNVKPLEFVITTHVSCAALGILCALASLVLEYEQNLFYSVLLFIATGAGGLFLFKAMYSNEVKPLTPIFMHASLGLLAFCVLIFAAFK